MQPCSPRTLEDEVSIASISVTSITGKGSQHRHQTMINHGVSKGKDLNLGSRGSNLQGSSIVLERGWDINGGIG